MSSGGEKGEFKGERNQKSNCKHPMGHRKSRGFQKSSYFYFIDYAKGFYCVDPNKMWKILKKKKMGIPEHLTCLLRNCMQVRKQQLELDMGQQIGSK